MHSRSDTYQFDLAILDSQIKPICATHRCRWVCIYPQQWSTLVCVHYQYSARRLTRIRRRYLYHPRRPRSRERIRIRFDVYSIAACEDQGCGHFIQRLCCGLACVALAMDVYDYEDSPEHPGAGVCTLQWRPSFSWKHWCVHHAAQRRGLNGGVPNPGPAATAAPAARCC